MSRLSLLPSDWTNVEAWLTRFFLILALLTIGPWAAIFLYDVLLYLLRYALHEVPLVGGRARGRQRPRAPSLVERPGGEARAMLATGLSGGGGGRRERRVHGGGGE